MVKVVSNTNEKSNEAQPIYDDITNVAVDNGYADQKIAYWAMRDGKRVIEEVLKPSRAQMGAINVAIDGKSSGVYEIEGDLWTVGRDVTEPESIRGERYAYSELNTVLVNHSLIAAGFSGKKVNIATGLPFEHYFKNGEKNNILIDKVKKSLRVKVNSKGDLKPAVIVSHELYPESTFAFVDYAVDTITGEMNIQIENGLAVVDIGGNTTDITYINSGNEVDSERSGSKKLGVLNVRDRLRQLVQNKFDVAEVRDSQLDYALRTGNCKIFGKSEDVSELIDAAKKESVKKLMNYIQETVGDASDLDKILFVGGGAAVLSDVIKKYPHAHIPDRPQFANARGMLKFMSLQDEQ